MLQKFISIIIFLSFLFNVEAKSQCFNLAYSNCTLFGDTVQLSTDNGLSGFWTITDPSGNILTPIFPFNYYNSYDLVLSQTGNYLIKIDQSSSSPSCSVETFIYKSNVSPLDMDSLPINNLCQSQTIDLSSFLNVTNVTVNPLTFKFYANGNIINNWQSYIVDSGNTVIDVIVTDGSFCSDSTSLIFDATANSITPPEIIIKDSDSNLNIIKPCGSTSLDFIVSNPDSNFNYSWNIQGNNYIGSNITQFVNAPTVNPGNIIATLSVYDSISACNVDFVSNISSVGLGNQIGAGLQTDIVPLCAGNINLLWVENGSNAILDMGPGDTISWEISCGTNVIDTNTWSYLDLPNYLTPHPFISNEQVAGFPANFTFNSCGCDDPANGTTDQFKIKAVLTSACLSNSVTIATWKSVNDPLQAEFISQEVCIGDSTEFINTSFSGCDGNTFDSNEDTLRYYWDFGDCSSVVETFSIANSGNEYPNITHLYSNPGTYTVQLVTESYCGTDTVSYPVKVRPNPILDISGTDVCFRDTTKFFSNALPATDTIISYLCNGSDINVLIDGGDSLFTYSWSMVDNQDGIYVNGTSSSSANPEFIFNTCGIKSVSLTINDSSGCQKIDSIIVTVFDLPTAILSNPNTNDFFCTGNPINIIDSSISGSTCLSNSLDSFEVLISENFDGFNTIYSQVFSNSPIVSQAIDTKCSLASAYNLSYNIVLVVKDSFGCIDSVSTLITAICDTATSDTISCLTFDWNGQVIDSSGTYYQSFTNSYGCDSTHALNIQIYTPDTVFTDVTSCNIYNWNGQVLDSSGTYVQVLKNIGGCDSIVFLNLNINYSDTSVQFVTACDSYTWINGVTYNFSSDTTSYTLQTTNGCDSVVKLDLTILSSSNIFSYSYSETYEFTGTSQMFIVPSFVHSVNIQLYGAEGGGRILSNNSSSGYGGAGAFVSGNLAVNPFDTLYIYVGGHGESSTYGLADGGWNGGGSGHGSGSSEPGNGGGGASDIRYGDTTLNHRVIVAGGGGGGGEDGGDQYSSGCGLQGVYPNNYRTGSQIAGGSGNGVGVGSFGLGGSTDRADGGGGGGGYFGGGTSSSPNIGSDSQGGGGGSSYVGGVTDSSISVWYPATNAIRSGHGQAILTYDIPAFGYIDTIDACNSYTWIDGVTYFSDNNTSTYTLTNSDGCDSTILLNLTIHTYDSIISNVNACDSFRLNGITYDSSGTYVYSDLNIYGCDSTFILNLVINQTNDSYTTITTCDSLLWNGSVYTESGIYTYDGLYEFYQLGQDINGEYSYDYSGHSVSLSSDGNIVAVGAFGNDGNGSSSGHVRIYENNNGSWNQLGQDIDGETAGDYSGYSVSLSSNGNIIAIGAIYNDGNGSNSGHVRIYKYNNGSWTQLGQDIEGESYEDQSGYSVSLSSEGNVVVIGSRFNDGNGTNSGHVRVFKNNNGSWNQLGQDINGEAANDYSGHSVSISSDGNIIAIGATYNDANGSNSGHVRIYENNNGSWVQLGQDIDGEAYNDQSGYSVSLSSSGETIAIGAPYNSGNGTYSGHVRIYNYNGSSWNQVGQDINGEATYDYSGHSVSLSSDGNKVAIGAYQNDANGSNSGHVRIYEYNNGSWTQLDQDIDGEAYNDQSGYSVSLSSNGETVAVGARYNYGNGTYSGHVRVSRLDILKNASGCDSTAILDLTVLKSDTTSNSITSCKSYFWNGQLIDSSGVYTQIFTDQNGCDSTHILDITIGLPDSVSSTLTQCDSINWNGQLIYSSGIYSQTFTNSYGCDSIHTLLAYIITNHNISSSIVSCNGSYIWNGQVIDSSGIYSQSFINIGGCDSIHTLTAIILNTDSTYSSINVCDSLIWNGQIIDSSGIYLQTFTSTGGCDSTHTLSVNVVNSNLTFSTVKTCDGYYNWNGQHIDSSGTYSQNFINIFGCDSTHFLTAIIGKFDSTGSFLAACDTVNWSRLTIDSSGTYTQNFTNVFGCDSVHTLIVSITPVINTSSFVYACDSYFWENQNITQSGVYSFSYKSLTGCDSIHSLTVTISRSDSITSNITACDTLLFNNQIITQSGIYIENYTNISGCDSIHTLIVNINNRNSSTSAVTSCTKYDWNGQIITSTGFYNQTLTNSSGCDSLHTLLATIIPPTTTSSTISTCNSYDWNGQIINNSGTYTQSFKNLIGCDSIHNLTVIVNSNDSVFSNDSSCNDYNWNGQILTSSGIYTQSFFNISGCDSIHILNYTKINNRFDSVFQTINLCTGDTYTIGNSSYSNNGTYYDVFINSQGCDSIIETNLIINQSPILTIDSISHVGCNGGIFGSVYISASPGSYTYLWSNGSSSQDLINVTPGNYSVIVSDTNGCSTFESFNILSTNSSLITSYNVDHVSCFGGSDGKISVLASGGIPPYVVEWSTWTGQTIFNLSVGDYAYNVTDASGCTVYDTVTINQPNELIIDTTVVNNVSCYGLNDGYASFNLSGGSLPYTIDWGGVNPFLLSAGFYNVLIFDANGCLITENITISEPPILSSNMLKQDVTCHNGNNGAIDLAISGGSPPYSTVWNNGSNTEDISNLSSSLYSVVITDSNGCSEQNSAYVSEPLPIVNNISLFLCEGDDVIIGNDTIVASLTMNVNNTFNLTSLNGCDSILNISYTVYPSPLIPTITQIFAATFEVTNGPFNDYQWYLNSDSIKGEVLSSLNFYQSGIYSVKVTNSYGCISTSASFPVGITSIANDDNIYFNVFPNPTTDILFLNTPSELANNFTVELYDWKGKKVHEHEIVYNNHESKLNLTNLSSGVYQLILKYENGFTFTNKIVKQ